MRPAGQAGQLPGGGKGPSDNKRIGLTGQTGPILNDGAVRYLVWMIDSDSIIERFASLSPHLDERGRRLLAATEANSAGYGGIAAVARLTGIAPSTIGRGRRDLEQEVKLEDGRLRRPGGGRKPLSVTDPDLLPTLLALVEPTERGDPMSALRWTCKSLRRLAGELHAQGHRVSHTVIGELLTQQKFSLQSQHPAGRRGALER
jgi:hypothetical protein